MSRMIGFRVPTVVGLLIGLGLLVSQPTQAAPGAPQKSGPVGQAVVSTGPSGGVSFGGYVQPYFFPSFSPFGWGGFYSPFFDIPRLPPAYPYLPKYWWVGPYPEDDPRQAGYNPDSGYPKETVTTLLLVTYPLKTRIILDGVFVGTSNYLGPIQLPIGEHTLRVEAVGYEPSETVLKIEEPVLEQLEIRLKPLLSRAKPAPRQ